MSLAGSYAKPLKIMKRLDDNKNSVLAIYYLLQSLLEFWWRSSSVSGCLCSRKKRKRSSKKGDGKSQ